MRFETTDQSIAELRTNCLALPLAAAREFDESLTPRGYLRSVLRDLKDKAGEVLRVAMPEGAGCQQVIAYGTGEVVTLKELRKIGAAIGKAIKAHEATHATLSMQGVEVQGAKTAASNTRLARQRLQ